MNRFTLDELRRAVIALDVIEARGDPDQWILILRDAQNSAPSDKRWGNATLNQSISGALLAAKISVLLDEDRDRCEQAAADVFGRQRHRAVFDALILYAAELTGQPSPANTAPTPQARPAVRIIAEGQMAK